jgi:hypothetical protein
MSGLSWVFPLDEMSVYLGQNMTLIMPLLVIILSVLLALVLIDGITESLLKVFSFVVNAPINAPSGNGIGQVTKSVSTTSQSQTTGENNDDEPD